MPFVIVLPAPRVFQDVMGDQPRNVPRLNFAQAILPHVPRVPEPMPNDRAMATVGGECPWLGAGIIEAVSHAFEALGARSPEARVKTDPPPSIKREAPLSRCGGVLVAHVGVNRHLFMTWNDVSFASI